MRSSSFVSLALLGAVTPTRLRAQTPAPVSTTPRLTGYLQPRFQAVGDSASFFLRRARFALEGAITPWASYRAQVEMRTIGAPATPPSSPLTLSATDLWIKVNHQRWGGTVGQFRVPFSLESLLSSTTLETTERSRIVNAAKRDIGAQAEWSSAGRLTLQAAVVNGEGPNRAANPDNRMAYYARAVVTPLKGLDVGGAFEGYSDSTGVDGQAVYRGTRWTARAEYIREHNQDGRPHDRLVHPRGVQRGAAASAARGTRAAVRSERSRRDRPPDWLPARTPVLLPRRQLQNDRRLRGLPGAGGPAGEQPRRGADAGEVVMKRRAVRRLGGWAVSLAAAVLTACPPNRLSAQSREVLLATTTSTRDAGLLDSLLPVFQRQTGYRVKVIAVGSGQALAMGRRGDADVVLSHAPEAERVLVDSGYFVRRRLVMHNDFLVVGPPADPAGLRGMSDAVAAFRRLAERPVVFVSRGDQSGTHQREQALWKRARLSAPPFGGSYVESGQGMGATLQLADEKHGYTLTDRATYLAWRDKLQLVPLVEGDPLLYNVYHVLELNPKNAPRINVAGGRAFAEFLVSPGTQALIGAFDRARFGRSLFVPDADKPDSW